MKFYPHRQMSESFITAAFLSVSGGLQDAYTYIFRGKVFANAQTGNIVLLGQNLVDRNWRMCVHYAVPLLFFALGIAAAECIKQKFQNMQQFHWRQIVVLCEIFLLLIVGFLPINSIFSQMPWFHFHVPCRFRHSGRSTATHLPAPCALEISEAAQMPCVHTSEQRTGTHCSNPYATGRSSCYSESVPLWAVTSSVYLI